MNEWEALVRAELPWWNIPPGWWPTPEERDWLWNLYGLDPHAKPTPVDDAAGARMTYGPGDFDLLVIEPPEPPAG